ncbi:MAG: InlB B-repeat-containing protein [Treponema sp.]|nr:InlB B-repeat-containing protein [Treponema sp.]
MKQTLLWKSVPMFCALLLSSCTIGLGTAVNVVKEGSLYYKINYQSDYGTVPESSVVSKGEQLTERELPELKARGLIFEGWYEGASLVNPGCVLCSDTTLTARWKNGDDAVYSVKYFFQNEEGNGYEYFPEFDSECSGEVFELTDYSPQIFTGFTSREVEQKTILPEGKTCLEIYNDRNIITLTLKLFDDEVIEVKGLYGSCVNIDAPEKKGYLFLEWNPLLPETFLCDSVYKSRWTKIVPCEFTVVQKEDINIEVLEADSSYSGIYVYAECSSGFDTYYWYVDGNYEEGNDTDVFYKYYSDLNDGIHTITVIAVDCDGETFSCTKDFETVYTGDMIK